MSLAEIEHVLARQPGVVQAAVLACKEQNGSLTLRAAVVSMQPEAALLGRLHEALRSQLPGYMIPAQLALLPAFETTPTGKVDREALARALEARAAQQRPLPVEPGLTSEDRRVIDLLASELEIPPPRAIDPLKALGLSSLRAVVLHSRIEAELGRSVPLDEVLQAQTLEELLRVVRDADAS